MEKEVEKEIQEILRKNNLKISYSLSFPMYKILPDEVKLALLILNKHGIKIVMNLNHQKELIK